MHRIHERKVKWRFEHYVITFWNFNRVDYRFVEEVSCATFGWKCSAT